MKLGQTKAQKIVRILLIIFVIATAVLVYFYLKHEAQCQGNPFVYSAQQSYKQGMEVQCSCIPTNPKYSPFVFNREEVRVSPVWEFSGP